LKVGIYTDIGPTGCSCPYGSYNHYEQDCKQFASWGIDYVKADACGNVNIPNWDDSRFKEHYQLFRDAVLKCGRPIVFAICNWGLSTPWEWGTETANLWRINWDITNAWDNDASWQGQGIIQEINQNANLAQYAGPGHWNDMDMMELGNGVMSATEDQSHFSMWCILASPLIAGNDLRTMSQTTKNILTNKEVIAVDQDSLGKQGTRIKSGNQEVWVKPIADGGKAVALFNRGENSATISFSPADIGLQSTALVRDLWAHQDKGTIGTAYSASVPSHGVVMLRVGGIPKVLVSGVTISPASISLVLNDAVGKSAKVTATLLPSNATGKGLVWRCSDTTIASIAAANDSTATVTGKKTGSCTITAVATYDTTKKGTCSVTVVPATGVQNQLIVANSLNGRARQMDVRYFDVFGKTVSCANVPLGKISNHVLVQSEQSGKNAVIVVKMQR
jgi:alpha-galactosidase